MPVDPQAQAVLDRAAAAGLPPLHTITPEEARANFALQAREAGPEVGKVEDRNIPGPAGGLDVRIYHPEGPGPFGVLVWFHGGGWVLGDLDSTDCSCRHMTNRAGCVVVSVDYRLAPETKFPGNLEDCLAATEWVAANAASLNVDVGRIAVGGASAGGNLAGGLALMARGRGGPSIVHQLLVYPVVGRDFDTESHMQCAEGFGLTRASMMWFWQHYLATDADGANPYAAMDQAQDLSGLPPALVITAEYDPLRDEGERYARRLEEAGTPVVCTRYDGMTHGFFSSPKALDKGDAAIDEASAALRAVFGG